MANGDRSSGDEFSPEELGPVVLWPTSAIEGAMDAMNRLYAIIDRAADSLPTEKQLEAMERAIRLLPPPVALDLADVADGIKAARAILAEAEPEDPEA